MTQDINLINKEAIIYLRSVTEYVSPACEPLFKNSPITACHYSRLFSEGRYLGLNTNSVWGEHIIKHGYQWRTSFFQSELKNLSTSNFRRLPWPSTNEDALIQNASSLRKGGGITFAKIKNDYIESYNFVADIDNFSVQLFYINNLSMLEDFIQYFQSKICHLVTPLYPFAISPTKIKPEFFADDSLQKDLLNYKKHIKLNINSNLYSHFSTQELKCIYYISQGKTAKESARCMNLSPRTIEHYIDSIRRKTGHRKKVEIIKFFENLNLKLREF